MTVLRDALARKDGVGALDAALVWWRAERSPKLADLIDTISERVSGPAIEDDREWAKVAGKKDPIDLGRLLPSIRKGTPSLPASFLPRAAELLAAFPDDPRLAKAIATWALDPPTTSSSTYPFWTKMLDRFGAIGDVRAVPLIKKRLAKPQEKSQFWPKFYKALERAMDKLKEVSAPLLSCDEAALKKLSDGAARLTFDETASTATATPSSSSSSVSRTTARVQARKEDVPKVEGSLLNQAATHLAAGRVAPAIDVMAARWRETRMPAIADAIDRANRLLPSWNKPLGTTDKEVHEAWLAAAADDPGQAMPQLLQNVSVGGASLAERHLLELEAMPDDPRVTMRLAEVAGHSDVSPVRTQYWKSLFQLLARGRDVRTCAPLRKSFNDFTGTYYNNHRQGRRIVGAFVLDPSSAFPSASWPLTLEHQDQKDLTKIDAHLAKLEAKKDRTEYTLLAAIAESWQDDAPRLVYADWLSERGHPRGELIVLACKKTLTKAEKTRLKLLEKAPYIQGMMDDVGREYDRVLERGLIRKLHIRYGSVALSLRAVAWEPLLSIVEKIQLETYIRYDLEGISALMLHADARQLQRVEGVVKEDCEPLEELVKSRFRLEGSAFVRK